MYEGWWSINMWSRSVVSMYKMVAAMIANPNHAVCNLTMALVLVDREYGADCCPHQTCCTTLLCQGHVQLCCHPPVSHQNYCYPNTLEVGQLLNTV